MEELQNDFKLINAYLKGTLDLEKMAAFEARMKNDETFAREVKIQQEMIRNIKKVNEEKNLREMFHKLDHIIPEPHSHWYSRISAWAKPAVKSSTS